MQFAGLIRLTVFACALLYGLPTFAQFREFDNLGKDLAKKLKNAKPHLVGVADFTAPDGSLSQQGNYFAQLLAASFSVHEKKLPVAEHRAFDSWMANAKLSASDLAAAENLERLSQFLDFIVVGTVETQPASYNFRVSARRVKDASEIFTGSAVIPRTEFVDSLTEPFPPQTDYPIYNTAKKLGSAAPTPPKCIYCPDPIYTNLARSAKLQGSVVFNVLISAHGEALRLHLDKMLGYGLDEQAFNAIKRWRFKPATLPDGTPVACLIPIEVTFHLF